RRSDRPPPTSRARSKPMALRAGEKQGEELLLDFGGERPDQPRAQQRHLRGPIDEAEEVEIDGDLHAAYVEARGDAPAEASGRARSRGDARLDRDPADPRAVQ